MQSLKLIEGGCHAALLDPETGHGYLLDLSTADQDPDDKAADWRAMTTILRLTGWTLLRDVDPYLEDETYQGHPLYGLYLEEVPSVPSLADLAVSETELREAMASLLPQVALAG